MVVLRSNHWEMRLMYETIFKLLDSSRAIAEKLGDSVLLRQVEVAEKAALKEIFVQEMQSEPDNYAKVMAVVFPELDFDQVKSEQFIDRI